MSAMLARGYDKAFAGSIFVQIQGFGEYGFPESHAASFALLVYASSWLKCHEPEAFLCAMLNSQPMGFCSPSQLVQDAKRHDGVVLPVDVTRSGWDSALEDGGGDRPAVRLGLSLLSGMGSDAAWQIEAARSVRAFTEGVNVIVWESVQERFRREALGATLLAVYGTGQCEGEVRHLVASRLEDRSFMLRELQIASRNFC